MSRDVCFISIIVLFISGCHGPKIGSVFSEGVNNGVPNFAVVMPNQIYRGGQPTKEGFDYLLTKKEKNPSIITILKLNEKGLDEEKQYALDQKVKFEQAVIQPDTDWPFQKVDESNISKAMKILIKESNWPIYVHCSHGIDRTGLIVAMFRVCKNNYNFDRAEKEMREDFGARGFRSLYLKGLSDYWEEFKKNPQDKCSSWSLGP